MIMIAVWYDPDCDQIWISDEERSYARRSLVSFIDAATGKIGIRLKAGTTADIVMTDVSNLTDRAGLGFLSALEAKAYLDGEFAKQRRLPPSITTGGSLPDDETGTAGDLYIDALSGDLYRKET